MRNSQNMIKWGYCWFWHNRHKFSTGDHEVVFNYFNWKQLAVQINFNGKLVLIIHSFADALQKWIVLQNTAIFYFNESIFYL